MKTRRWIVALAAGFFAVTAAFAGTISGRVFLDANGNGAFDAGEPGVAGCVVSDERASARSDGEGRYQLTLPAGPAAVFVVNAPGTWPAARWWSYIADGSTDATVDFPLRAQEQNGPLYFVQGTDIHIQTNAVPMYRRYIGHVNALPVPVKFVVHTGDLVVDSAATTMERARELFSLYEDESKALKPPLRNLMGNHDIAGVTNPKVKGDEPDFGKTLYRQRLGPVTYAFRYGPYHFLALDGTMIKERTLAYGLTQESADWAIRYLAGVKRDEPLVLLIHEPMFPEVAGVRQPDTPKTRPHEGRLRAALQGRKVLMTLAGHVHSRQETTWAGAPHILGGAVSYAWHGILPYPPTPRAYVLFRLEGGREEHVYLDWAEERSIDIATPEFTALLRGRQKISGIVADFNAEVTAVECAIGDQKTTAKTSRKGNLATGFEAALDTSKLNDGAYDLLVTARAGDKQWTERHPCIVVNGKPAGFAATTGAKLSFRVEGKLPADSQVSCNGHPLVLTAASATEFRCDVPADQLRRLNELVIRAGPSRDPKKPAVIKSVALDYNGKRCRDVRYAPLARRPLTAAVTAYVDLVYEDLNSQPPK
ncbi:MAG: metallophosphoesterase [Verrucomicrobia bacterium]|nr:metallophosphoesterase [Verrucomicrobiota bacterium]